MALLLTCAALFGVLLMPSEAEAQTIPPAAERDETWDVVSNVSMVVGAATVFVMPRIYYADPESTIGWKARWHVSILAPAMLMLGATWFVDEPIRGLTESTRPGCTLDETNVAFPDSNCESFGGPSTQAFVAWGSTGAGLGIFLIDTLKYSDGKFHAGSFIGNVAVPLTAAVITSIGRAVEPGTAQAYEDGGQVVAGALPGFFSGLIIGGVYALLQEPNCGYGDAVFCW